MSSNEPFWRTEKDLTDAEQERIDPDREFESSQPDGAAKSVRSADEIQFDEPLDSAIEERAEAIQSVGNDPDIPDRYEDDVYTSDERAEQALRASALRGLGAAQSSRGVESSVQWALARVDDFAKTVKTGETRRRRVHERRRPLAVRPPAALGRRAADRCGRQAVRRGRARQ